MILLEAMRSVFTPGFRAIEENLPGLGRIRRVSSQYCRYSSRYDKFKAGIIENAFNPALSKGALVDIGVYCVHPLAKLPGRPDRVVADALFPENGVDGAGTILGSWKCGMQSARNPAEPASGSAAVLAGRNADPAGRPAAGPSTGPSGPECAGSPDGAAADRHCGGNAGAWTA